MEKLLWQLVTLYEILSAHLNIFLFHNKKIKTKEKEKDKLDMMILWWHSVEKIN